MPRLRSVNTGTVQSINWGGHPMQTGIYKQPVDRSLLLGPDGFSEDQQADLKHHGGPDKAALVYIWEHYKYWEQTLGRGPFPCGQFGETLTVEGLSEQQVHIGDRFRIGQCTVEVSQPRTPCWKLAARMRESRFPQKYLASGRVGFYVRVIDPGIVAPGDEVLLLETRTESMTVAQLSELKHAGGSVAELRRAAAMDGLAGLCGGALEDMRDSDTSR